MGVEPCVHLKGSTEYPAMLPKVQPDVCPLDISVLAVSPHPEDHRRLTDIFQHSRWQLRTASNLAEALSILSATAVPVVICEYRLEDGDWRVLQQLARSLEIPSRVLVTMRHADESIWAEILEAGGYDCLPKPFRSDEVYRLVSLAWRSWKDQFDRGTHFPRSTAAGNRT